MDLPKIGDAEDSHRDYKKRYSDDEEKRKKDMVGDVVAMANGVGGKLYVGVESAGERVKAVDGLSGAEAEKTSVDIQRFVKDLCDPVPIINCTAVDLPSGRVVVVVDVQPYPGQAVGFRLSRGGTDGPWHFPVRVVAQTRWYTPQQLVLLMDVKLRRTLQQLHLARQAGSVAIVHQLNVARGVIEAKPIDNTPGLIFKISDVSDVGASMCLTATMGGLSASAIVPIDSILFLWQTSPTQWTVYLAGECSVTNPVPGQMWLKYSLNPAFVSRL